MEAVLYVTAVGFALVNGLNDGGALVAVGLRVRSLTPLAAVALLSVAVAVVPLLVGTAVAGTLASRLVTFEGRVGEVAIVAAVATAVVVPALLVQRGLPTSLSLAVVGAISGAGLGAGLEIDPWAVVTVLLLAAAAPLLALGAASVLTLAASTRRYRSGLHVLSRRWHLVAYVAQCFAYGANDGQKMLAIKAVAVGTVVGGGVPVVGWQLAVVGLAFLAGTLLGFRRVARTFSGGIVPVRPPDVAITELAAASVVLGTGLMGFPVSMTQSLAGAQVGTGMTRGLGRIRWRQVGRICAAWLVTLPVAGGLAAVVTAMLVPLVA